MGKLLDFAFITCIVVLFHWATRLFNGRQQRHPVSMLRYALVRREMCIYKDEIGCVDRVSIFPYNEAGEN